MKTTTPAIPNIRVPGWLLGFGKLTTHDPRHLTDAPALYPHLLHQHRRIQNDRHERDLGQDARQPRLQHQIQLQGIQSDSPGICGGADFGSDGQMAEFLTGSQDIMIEGNLVQGRCRLQIPGQGHNKIQENVTVGLTAILNFLGQHNSGADIQNTDSVRPQ